MFERQVSVHLRLFMERCGALPTTKFAYRKSFSICDAPFCVSHALQSVLESEQEDRILQIDYSAAFEMVNHQGILYKLCTVSIGASMLSILTLNLSQLVMVDGCRSKLVNIVTGVLQGSALSSLLFLL